MTSILLVEDHAWFRRTLKEVILQAFSDARVFEAEDGTQAIDLFHEHMEEIELALVDINIPAPNGLAVTREVKTEKPNLLVAILTNHDSDEYRDAAEEAGADHFFTKANTSISDLVRLINKTNGNNDGDGSGSG
ncbi:MAG: response regulator transcription factor [Desulfatibacillaceae bacterium]